MRLNRAGAFCEASFVSARFDDNMPIKVAIVDDDEGIRSSLATLIRRAPSLRLIGDYPDGESALSLIHI